MQATVVVGNPKQNSRTRAAGERLVAALEVPFETIELADLGPGLLGWGDERVGKAVEQVRQSDIVIVASPTFKATYTGLLKLFLDQFPGGTGLQNVVAIPLMLGGSPAHSLAPDAYLRPVLVELGASCPTASLYQLDSSFDSDESLPNWIDRWAPTVNRALGRTE